MLQRPQEVKLTISPPQRDGEKVSLWKCCPALLGAFSPITFAKGAAAGEIHQSLFPGSAWWGGKPGPGQASPAQPSPWAWRNPHGHIWHRRRLGHKSMVQIPLAGGDDPLCKLTFPPSRASAKVVSLRFWGSTGLSPITSQKGGAGAKVHQLGFLAGRGQARLGSRRSCTKCQNPRQNRKRLFWNTCSRKSCFLADLGFGGAPNKNLARPARNPNWWTFAPAPPFWEVIGESPVDGAGQ